MNNMSLNCYPLGEPRSITLHEQPIAIDVGYSDNLFVSITDQCSAISVYELSVDSGNIIAKFSLGDGIVMDQILYCQKGDYIACVGHNNGQMLVHIVTNWRHKFDADFSDVDTREDIPVDVEKPLIARLDYKDDLNSIDCCQWTGNLAMCCGTTIYVYKYLEGRFEHVITIKPSLYAISVDLLENYISITASDHVQVLKLEMPDIEEEIDHSNDECIYWNLNTKNLVKLPTLMHNTSTSLSSFHVCHSLELLGPTAESIACRVTASIYSSGFCQNQIEAVVMLCKQFDYDRDPARFTSLQAVYLSSKEDLKRLNKETAGIGRSTNDASSTLLKSDQYDLLASVTCFVSTLTNCFVYALHGNKVARLQTITHPDLCLDLRADLLNVYSLTSLGLQIYSTGTCDSAFRYDWSSTADLNLSFAATDRLRVLASSRFIILIACLVNGQCLVEFMEKPNLVALFNRIVHTVSHCDSISIRSNMLTYLHATAQLALIGQPLPAVAFTLQPNGPSESSRSSSTSSLAASSSSNDEDSLTLLAILKKATIMLCRQLLQKKQTNVITNSKIDENIKHLLDISMCDLMELMQQHKSVHRLA